MRDVQGTSEVGINEPPRSSFTKELLPLLVWPTTNRVDFLAEYDDRRCFSASVIRSAFMLSLSCCLIRSIKPCVSCEHFSKKVINEVKSLNWSSNEDDVSRLETAMKKIHLFKKTANIRCTTTSAQILNSHENKTKWRVALKRKTGAAAKHLLIGHLADWTMEPLNHRTKNLKSLKNMVCCRLMPGSNNQQLDNNLLFSAVNNC